MEDDKDLADKLRTHLQSKEIKTTTQLRTRIREMPNLPQDVIAEILVRLPVKSLVRFRCVSKSWFSFISSPKFIKTHLAYSTHDPTIAGYRLVLSISTDPFSKDPFRVKHCSLSSVFGNLLTDEVEAEFPNTQTSGVFWIAGSCNGLLCVCAHKYSTTHIFLWNPSLRMLRKLPPETKMPKYPGGCIYGIGYDEPNDDYKVVRLFRLFSEMVEIYSSKNDSWKTIKGFEGCIRSSSASAIYANGKFHFLVYYGSGRSKSNIVSLDIENEVYGIVELPEVERPKEDNLCSGIYIGVLKGCITALYNYERANAEFWVLKEYGVRESWTKLVSIPCSDRPSRGYIYPYRSCILLNGKYLLRCEGAFVVYDPEDNSFLYPQRSNEDKIPWSCKGMYVESLVLLSS